MFERLSQGWALAKQSLQVLKLDKELLLFPIFSSIACLLVVLSFGLPIFYSGIFDGIVEQEGQVAQGTQILFYVLCFLFYFACYFVIIFFNSALIGAAIIRLKGGDPTVRDGIGAAMARLPQIAGWALVSATVGLILKAIESRSERVGQIVANLIGMAWAITTFFVVPVLVVEKAGPIEAVKRSVSIMRDAWGESLGAKFGIGFFSFLASLLGVAAIMGGIFLMSSSQVLGGTLIAIGVIWILLVALVTSALTTIMRAALYVYAVDGKAPEMFDESMIRGAFAPK